MLNLQKRLWFYIILILLAAGCSGSPPINTQKTPEPTQTLPPPRVHTTQAPDAEAAARAYLEGWKSGDYDAMYALLAKESQDSISQADFSQHYQDVAAEAALKGLEYEIISDDAGTASASVNYKVTLHSSLAGEVQGETRMNLVLEEGQWRVKWDDTLVLADLSGGNYLKMDRSGYTPARGNIYDRNGNTLVAQEDATAIGLRPDLVDPDQADALYSVLSRVTGVPIENLVRLAENALPGDYIPLGEVPTSYLDRRGSALYNLSGVDLVPYTSRFYYSGGIAPHLIGYVGQIQAGEVLAYRLKGYLKDELVGQSGLEAWGEGYLEGKRGGALYVNNAEHQPIRKLAESLPEPSQAITTTLDMDLQLAAQQSLQGFSGAAVVLERDTGRVLAMASSPEFDPNAFAPGNNNSYAEISQINSPTQPLYDRAAQGQYPLGSVFKIITMAAALQSGLYTPETTYDCGYEFNELPGFPRYDWTWEYFQEDGKTQPSGLLDLRGGLIRSCDPFFWHIGLGLFDRGLTKAVSDMARGFGLGSPTGLEGEEEMNGNVPDPASQVDALNLAIGQGDLQVTPLQVADFVAAVGNGGTLYRPQVIERIAPPNGEASFTFQPEVRGSLPVSAENLKVIQEAMTGVVSSAKPRGTAYYVFNGLNFPVAGKTGTVQTGEGFKPHAWFVAYTNAGLPNKPDIALAVVIENAGEGADFAAPFARRLIEVYFRGRPGKLFPWEQTYYVEKTPEPEVTETPAP
jgi:cell division protein FtsI/penicillin-binding protein 2